MYRNSCFVFVKDRRNAAIKEEQPGWSIIPDVLQITLYFITQSLFNLKAVVIVILEQLNGLYIVLVLPALPAPIGQSWPIMYYCGKKNVLPTPLGNPRNEN